jgi:ketosteroid isomerase-like protein
MKTITAPTITTTATTNLPAAVKRYLAAANRFDALVAADCFTDDAAVYDEDHDCVGRDAIRGWVAETSSKFHPAFTVMRASVNGDDVTLAVAVSGRFPGSPVTLDFMFRLRNGKILLLTIV